MASYYFDSNALAKLYHSESGSDTVDRIADSPANRVVISRLAVVEMSSVFAIKVRTGFLAKEKSISLRSQFYADVSDRRFEIRSISEVEFQLAATLVDSYAHEQRLRTLDAI